MFGFFQNLFNSIRSFFWCCIFNNFSLKVYGKIKIFYYKNINIGKNVFFNHGLIINARGTIKIGDNVHLSTGVIINTGSLDYKKTGFERVHVSKPVSIEEGVWIGSGAIINPGVTIGKNSVIGAGAVVTSDIPENVVAVGVPARVIKNIND